MPNQALLSKLQSILQTSNTEVGFAKLLPLLGEELQCDRCFLYLRNPHSKMGKVTHCWRRNSHFPDLIDSNWKPEPDSLPQADPLFAAALRAEPSIFVEDVATANPQVVNREFEQQNFGHRALIHAHLRQNGLLWGILQPCIFNHPRVWTEFDQSVIAQVEKAITPIAIAYIKAANV